MVWRSPSSRARPCPWARPSGSRVETPIQIEPSLSGNRLRMRSPGMPLTWRKTCQASSSGSVGVPRESRMFRPLPRSLKRAPYWFPYSPKAYDAFKSGIRGLFGKRGRARALAGMLKGLGG